MPNNYKDTMNLPTTDFAMRANLPQNEPTMLAWWDEIDIYHKVLEKNTDGKPHILHDGPPYANGPIHIGHAFNKILKDFVNKSHAQRGHFTPYIPGWDCHGQPIEHEVEKKLGTEKMAALPTSKVRELCREWAEKFVDIQREGFKRLGVNADWDNPYLTFMPEYESANVEVFKQMYLDGSIYRGRKPIHWCSHCHTALAEAEIEYGDETSPSIFVAFKMTSVPEDFVACGVDPDHAHILIWTTTPWTLPANTAVCLGPDLEYCMVKQGGEYYLFAYEMVEQVAQTVGWNDYEIVAKDGEPLLFKGNELESCSYIRPIMKDGPGRVIWGSHVTLDAGTGCVHTAPGHGVEDYLAGQEFGIDSIMPVDDDGRFMEFVPLFAGLEVNEANPKIIEWLREQGVLVHTQEISHSYPHCWRCHQPVIFRATDQWFVSMDSTGLREAALDQIYNKVRFIPDWGKNRIGSMVQDRPDWCISRQRSWGVPIPVFKCGACGETIATEQTFDAVIDLFNNEGADAWFTKEPSSYLPNDTCCPSCGSHDVVAEKDILDVWWESGVSHVGVLRHREQRDRLAWPADMYLEGSDQHRGWFQSSLLCGVGAFGSAPYRDVMCCGFTVDEEGRKMSKSLGNGVDPQDVISKYGADVLRLWVSSTDYSVDVSISDNILERTSDAYRKFRNTFRYLLGSLSDFDDTKDAVASFEDLEPLDQWALVRLSKLLQEVEAAYDEYKFHQVFRLLYDYTVGDLSSVYLDAIKDRLYSEAPNSPRRRSAQTVVMNILEVMVRILAPILSFTTEEVWKNYPEAMRVRDNRPASVQLAGWPVLSDFQPSLPDNTADILSNFDTVLQVRECVSKALEDAKDAKTISKSQEARIDIAAPREVMNVLDTYGAEVLEELLIVSTCTWNEGEEVSASVTPSDKPKCPRCWNHRELGGVAGHDDVCERCGNVLDDIQVN